MLSDVHHQRNVLCSYVLKLEGDEACPEGYYYCGWTRDLEMRILSHSGIHKPEQGAAWCKLHRPEKIESVTIHQTEAEAVLAEVASYNLWLARVGPERVRGGRVNCPGPLRYPPRGWPRQSPLFGNEEGSHLGGCRQSAVGTEGGSFQGLSLIHI